MLKLYSKKNNNGNNKDKQIHSKLENTTSNTIEENENISNNIKNSSYSSTEPDKTDEFHDTVVKTPKDLAQKILKLDRTSNNDTTNNDTNYTPFFLKERKKQLILPHVPGNANIPNKDVQIEGLFAGPKPLFLGKSSIISDDKDLTPNYHTITDFFTTLEKIGEEDNDANNNNSTHNSTDIGEVINAYRNKKKNSRKPIIPWEASISGLIYNDKPFRTIPKSLISKLKPFKLINLEKKNTKDSLYKDNGTVKFKVHNSFVNDEVEMVNLFDITDDFSDDRSNSKSDAKKNGPFSKSTLITDANLAKEWYYREKMRYAEDYKFIKADQYVFKTYVTKLNKFLAKEFYKQTKLTINNQFRDHLLPLYIYVDKSICSKNRFQSYLRKKIIDNIEPILDTVCASYEDRKQAEAFHARVMIKVNAITKELSIYLPSVSY
ncbi:uncharacterized protein SCODWIG_01578 [Saccharomycodes ludwigii]|uniref:Uncharacterized protein n=1 Tax=Saccharomycodes ludwigii TaxID=36035 RepID=A0A376B549_9ASCO|nr:uncharacterized protein SCODWIG_01578 [Saccharomycodes ludwigii]